MELGLHYAVILPYIGMILTLAGTLAAASGRRDSAKLLTAGLAVLVAGWFVYMIPFIRLDYTLAEVARNANNDLPLSIRAATAWSGGGGSLYLYTTMISIGILPLLASAWRRGEEPPRSFLIIAGLVVLTAFASALLNGAFDVNPRGVGGLGLNPLLKNYWIIPHPLTTFGGYALLIAGALVAVYTGRRLLGMGVFVLGWSLLTLGIMFGAIWSYETFGWGGYWAWDPVEISELSVWLMATATLHMLGPLAPLRRGFLVATASTALFAPFVTRSGLSPLHSFAAADIGSAILLIGSIALLAIAIYEISGEATKIRPTLKPRTPAELADTSITMAGAAIAVMAVFVYASLLVPGILNLLGKQATVPTMRQGVEFYHPVLLPLFLFSILWLPGFFLARRLGVRGFTGLLLTELAIAVILFLAVKKGTVNLLPGAPEATKLQVAVALPLASTTLGAILTALADALYRKARSRARDVGLILLHTGMLLAFVGVLFSGTYAFNDRFFHTYTLTPDSRIDTGIVSLGLESYKYTTYKGTIDLKHHLSPNTLTAASAWLGIQMLANDLGTAVREVEFAKSQVEANTTLRALTDLLVSDGFYRLGNVTLQSTANASIQNLTSSTITIIATNKNLTLTLKNTTLIITLTPVTGQDGGLLGAWVVSGMQAGEAVIRGAALPGRISFHSPLQINMSTPVTVTLGNNTSLEIASLRLYPASNNTVFVVEGDNTSIRGGVFVEIANATLHIGEGRIRIPIPTGPGYYLLVALERGDLEELNRILACEPLRGILMNETLPARVLGPNVGELPALPEKAPSGLALDLVLKAGVGGSEKTIHTRIRFEANGEAMGIHGLVTPAVLIRKGLGDIYVNVQPPMVDALGEHYHEPLVRYARHVIETMPEDEALTLVAVMASGYHISQLSSVDTNHIGFLAERYIASLYVAADDNTSAIDSEGLIVMVKYVPGVNLVWAGVTIMAITGFVLGAIYLAGDRRA
ncbi:MAG: cytochrome c biogenesis protein CcsA [Desulfurococcales archaeon]|nr:cytochrome c biogenesis protein CcsA [Desulfurococcales archaeon]